MPIDGGRSSFTNWDKISSKIMDRDALDKFVRLFKEGKGSAIQVMKDEIANDENNHFIVENRRLRELLMDCKLWMDDIHIVSVDNLLENEYVVKLSREYHMLASRLEEYFNE
jgi:hypothetical protein